MNKVIISVLGQDRPGIIAAVSKTLFEHQCNIEDVSQTILQTEFAGVFIASVPDHETEDSLLDGLCRALTPLGLSVLLRRMDDAPAWTAPDTEPFVITTIGPDRLGLVAGITGLLAGFGVNITNLKAVFRGGSDPMQNTMIYEVDIPVEIDQSRFRAALQERARDLGLDISLQHRNVFEAIHRV
ncbi:MAG: ACT domain-containing protein [Syntrophobacteraceae bacterium]|nr:ACT domain-containing protein [Syntrophobacteraceae bacterium]